jgi:hypothetical protein
MPPKTDELLARAFEWLQRQVWTPLRARPRGVGQFHPDGFKYIFGWEVVVKVNSKNSFGGYEGYQTYRFFFRDNKLIKVIDPTVVATAEAEDQL